MITRTALAALLTLAVVVVMAAEIGGRVGGAELRGELYRGGWMGLLVFCTGLPFAARLGRFRHEEGDAVFWTWWGLAFMARLVALIASVWALARSAGNGARAPLLFMTAVFLAGLALETAWLARRFFKSDDAQKKNRTGG